MSGAQLDRHRPFKPVMVSVVSSNSYCRQLYFLLNLLKPLDVNFVQKCQKFVLFVKT